MECPSCGENPMLIKANYTYDIYFENYRWHKEHHHVDYECGNCGVLLDIDEIESILKQVDEL